MFIFLMHPGKALCSKERSANSQSQALAASQTSTGSEFRTARAILWSQFSFLFDRKEGPMKEIPLCLVVSMGLLILLMHTASAQWVQTNGPCSRTVTAFAVSGGNLFAGTSGGVFLSTNNAASWTAVDSGLGNRPVWSFAVSGGNLFAGTSDGLFSFHQ